MLATPRAPARVATGTCGGEDGRRSLPSFETRLGSWQDIFPDRWLVANWQRTCVSRLRTRLGLVVIGCVNVFIGSTIWAEIHVFVRVVAAGVAVRHVRRGVMKWTIVAGRTREDGTEFSDAGKDVGREGRWRVSGTMRRLCMVVMMRVMMPLLSEWILVVDRGATPASRFSRHGTVALFTLHTSTAARRRFTL